MLARRLKQARDTYYATADRRGLFVIVPAHPGPRRCGWVAVTCLRLGDLQRDVLTQLYAA